jgi:hypothetical protein
MQNPEKTMFVNSVKSRDSGIRTFQLMQTSTYAYMDTFISMCIYTRMYISTYYIYTYIIRYVYAYTYIHMYKLLLGASRVRDLVI